MTKIWRTSATLILIQFFLEIPAHATLGKREDTKTESTSPRANGRLQMARKSSESNSLYKINNLESETTKMREYVNSQGIVFGIAWNGIVPPDLDSQLGSYLPEYKKLSAENPRARGRRVRQLKSNQLVVQKWGHMRNLEGRAYDPALLPAGVSGDDIQ